jgi:hypothetical protein
MEILHSLRVVRFDHGFPGAIIGMNRELAHNDQAAFSLGPPGVVGDVSVGQPTPFGKIGSVGKKTDAVGEGGTAYLYGFKKLVKHNATLFKQQS